MPPSGEFRLGLVGGRCQKETRLLTSNKSFQCFVLSPFVKVKIIVLRLCVCVCVAVCVCVCFFRCFLRCTFFSIPYIAVVVSFVFESCHYVREFFSVK